MKNILLITNYFPPEKGAAPNRMLSLAESLGNDGYEVTVVCPLPSYPQGKIFSAFKGKVYSNENAPYGKIKRLWAWPSNSTNKIVRLLSMLSFCFSLSIWFIFTNTPKKIFVQYSPVFIGFTAVCLGRFFSKKIVLNVSDLWPLAGLEMGILRKGWYYSILLKMEQFCYRNADLIVGQSREILEHVENIEHRKPLLLYRNFPSFSPPPIVETSATTEIRIVYAGLLGMAQGILNICGKIKLPKNVSLDIFGSGPELENIKELKNHGIFYHGELERNELHQKMQDYDIAFVPLKNRIYGSVPSKIFEYSLLGMPILYYAGGEGGKIVEKNSLGWNIEANNLQALQDFINTISTEELNRFPKRNVQKNAIKAFNFEEQFQAFSKKIEAI